MNENRPMQPAVPEVFHQAVMSALGTIAAEEAATRARPGRAARLGWRIAILATAFVLALGTAAYAAYHWHLFDELSFFTGANPVNADEIMARSLHTETVNGVDITIREAGYDGRTLFIQYSYLVPDVKSLPETPYDYPEEAMDKLWALGLGWWVDHLWIDGKCMDMPAGSGSTTIGSDVPGEIIQTEYWRLDNLDVSLTGQVDISLPIGLRQDHSLFAPRAEHPDKYDAQGNMLLPDSGMVTFTLDTRDTLSRLVVEHPNLPVITDRVTATATEVCYTPLMTYITLDLTPNQQALDDYIALNGEGYYDEDGNLLFPYDGVDVYGDWISSLTLVDGDGTILFPGHYGCEGMSPRWAEMIFPYMEELPDPLYLAPVVAGAANMDEAIRIR